MKNPLRVLAAACMVAAGAALVAGIYAISITDKNATERDFIQYWAAGRQLAHGLNPYDVPAILHIEQSVGMDGNSPKVSLSPPVALEFALPLGHLGAKAGLISWLLVELACAGLAAWALWFLHGRPDSRYHLLVFAFPPALACLMAGQLGLFFLLGIALFLHLHNKRPWLAGAALLFCALKPHLFLPCLLVLLLWSAHRRNFRVVAGFLAALAASSALSLAIAPHAWQQYFAMLHSARLADIFIPTVSVSLRFLIDRDARWLEFLPEAAACVWAAWYYWSRRDRWRWTEQGLLLLLVSALCVPYAWFTDEAILFPAILAAIYRAEKSTRAWILLGVITATSLIGVLWEIPLPSAFYVWTTPAWFAWFLYAMRSNQSASTAI
ncbi:MAG TPA: glycosyltransferase family 87 protein [Terracidiphilus sp.]|nr:glycosyltransferase family 87 protein [Terracidiphilus sp.]